MISYRSVFAVVTGALLWTLIHWLFGSPENKAHLEGRAVGVFFVLLSFVLYLVFESNGWLL